MNTSIKKLLLFMIVVLMLCLCEGCTSHRQTASHLATAVIERIDSTATDSIRKESVLNLSENFHVVLHDVTITMEPQEYVPPDTTVPNTDKPKGTFKASKIDISSSVNVQESTAIDSVGVKSVVGNIEKSSENSEDTSSELKDGTSGLRLDIIIMLLVIAVALIVIAKTRKL